MECDPPKTEGEQHVPLEVTKSSADNVPNHIMAEMLDSLTFPFEEHGPVVKKKTSRRGSRRSCILVPAEKESIERELSGTSQSGCSQKMEVDDALNADTKELKSTLPSEMDSQKVECDQTNGFSIQSQSSKEEVCDILAICEEDLMPKVTKPEKRKRAGSRRRSADFEIMNTKVMLSPDMASPGFADLPVVVPITSRRSRRIRCKSIELYRAAALKKQWDKEEGSNSGDSPEGSPSAAESVDHVSMETPPQISFVDVDTNQVVTNVTPNKNDDSVSAQESTQETQEKYIKPLTLSSAGACNSSMGEAQPPPPATSPSQDVDSVSVFNWSKFAFL